jgi:hypothetical protein
MLRPPAESRDIRARIHQSSAGILPIWRLPTPVTEQRTAVNAPQPASQQLFQPQPQPEPSPAPAEPDIVRDITPEPAPPRRARRRFAAPLAAAAALLVLAAGGALLGVRLWARGTGAQPEDAVPASVAAFARIDLTPGYGQRLAFDALMDRFPGNGGSGRAWIDTGVGELVEDLVPGLDFDAARPWFGHRLGAGVWARGGQPVLLLTLATSDEDGARRALAAASVSARGKDLGFVVADGYALVARADRDAQPAAEEAAAAAHTRSLADHPAFRAAVAGLPADQPLLAWTDLALAGAVLGDSARNTPALFAGLAPRLAQRGTIAVGVRAVDNGLEIRARTSGLGDAAAPVDLRARLDAMPGSGAAAGVFAGGDGLGAALAELGRSGKGLGALLDGGPAGGRARSATLAGALRSAKMIDFLLTPMGADFPALTIGVQARDARSAAGLVAALGGLAGTPLEARRDGDRVTIGPPGSVTGGGRLADLPLYREAMADTPPEPLAAFYVDVQRLAAGLDAADAAAVTPVAAVGGAVGQRDTLIRVVIR